MTISGHQLFWVNFDQKFVTKFVNISKISRKSVNFVCSVNDWTPQLPELLSIWDPAHKLVLVKRDMSGRKLLIVLLIHLRVLLELGLRNNKIAQEVKLQWRFKTDPIKCVRQNYHCVLFLSGLFIPSARKLCIANLKQQLMLRRQKIANKLNKNKNSQFEQVNNWNSNKKFSA